MSRLLGALAGWKGYAALAAAMLVVGFAGGWTVRDWKAGADAAKAARSETKAAVRVIYRERAQADVTSRVEAEAAKAQIEIRYRTETLIEEVPVYVTVEADTRCIVPVGFVRLHDAAAAGDAVPEPAGVADDAPSAVALSAIAATLAGNYGDYHAVSRQLIDLQHWVRQQQAVTNAR